MAPLTRCPNGWMSIAPDVSVAQTTGTIEQTKTEYSTLPRTPQIFHCLSHGAQEHSSRRVKPLRSLVVVG